MRTYAFVTLTLLAGGELAAQKPCKGPGASFGITAYQCASCAIEQKPDQPILFTFNAEPVVLEVGPRSVFRAGDVVISTNDQPITTRLGSFEFTYPSAVTRVVVRRGGEQITLSATPFADCGDIPAGEVGSSFKVLADSITVRNDSTGIRTSNAPDGIVSNESRQHGRFGFALACVPSCTWTRASDGTEYWKYDGLPRVEAVGAKSPAFRAGMKPGDVLLQANGRSILEEAGALGLMRADRTLRLKLRNPEGTTRDATLTYVPRGSCAIRVVTVRNFGRQSLSIYVGGRLIGHNGGGRSTHMIPQDVDGAVEVRERAGGLTNPGGYENKTRFTSSVSCKD